ncbi:MAG: hypothetical protein F4Y49_02515 [Dehalococcoidia bacterium]|nr:hypothetical protein [Dehalococcoidia bacterium]
MAIDKDITRRIEQMRNEALDLSAESLRANDQSRSETLFDIAKRIQALIPADNVDDDGTVVNQPPSTFQVTPSLTRNQEFKHRSGTLSHRTLASSPTPIFAMRSGVVYDAELDTSRISSGGQGACIKFRDEWMTASKAANSITGTQVNGWQNFWRYERPDGTKGPIQELREQELRVRQLSSRHY